MTGSDITIEVFQKNSYISLGIKFFIATVACYLLAGLDYVYFGVINNNFGDSNPISIIILGMLAAVGMVLWIVCLIFLVMGLLGKSRYNKYIKENGEDAILNEIRNETLYIYSRKNRPVTIITRKHIFEVDRNIFSSTDIDYAYGYSYRGATSIMAFTITNKSISFANTINLRGEEKKHVFMALASINPDILLGFTSENAKEHRRRVKEYKKANR